MTLCHRLFVPSINFTWTSFRQRLELTKKSIIAQNQIRHTTLMCAGTRIVASMPMLQRLARQRIITLPRLHSWTLRKSSLVNAGKLRVGIYDDAAKEILFQLLAKLPASHLSVDNSRQDPC